jgi:hypothetical protein
MQEQIKRHMRTTALWIAVTILSLIFLPGCNDGREPSQTGPAQSASESFTFFDLGPGTKFTKNIRKELQKKLGRDAIERRSIIDLEINYRGFLKKYFPQLEELNRRLNFPPGERVEHNTVKLMYRYAQKKDVPFEYVELIFSGYTDTPILFRIRFRKDEANIVETLKTKYGPPTVIDWKEENGKSIFWKRNSDYMVASMVPDQFGVHSHQIAIFFVENLTELVDTEQMARGKREAQRAKSGKSAF